MIYFSPMETATITKTPNGNYEVEFFIANRRQSSVYFITLEEANLWAKVFTKNITIK